jgi:hypothetical protein
MFNLKKKSWKQDIDFLQNIPTSDQDAREMFGEEEESRQFYYSPKRFQKHLDEESPYTLRNDSYLSELQNIKQIDSDLIEERKADQKEVNISGTKVRHLKRRMTILKEVMEKSPHEKRKQKNIKILNEYEKEFDVLSRKLKNDIHEVFESSYNLYSIYSPKELREFVKTLLKRYATLATRHENLKEQESSVLSASERVSGKLMASSEEVDFFLNNNPEVKGEYDYVESQFIQVNERLEELKRRKRSKEITEEEYRPLYLNLTKEKKKIQHSRYSEINKINRQMFPPDNSRASLFSSIGKTENEMTSIDQDIRIIESILIEKESGQQEEWEQHKPIEEDYTAEDPVEEVEYFPENISFPEPELAYACSGFNLRKKSQKPDLIFYHGHETNDKDSFKYEYLTSDPEYASSYGMYVYKLQVNLENPWTPTSVEETRDEDWVNNYQDLEAQGFDGVFTQEGDGIYIAIPFRSESVQILEINKNLPV